MSLFSSSETTDSMVLGMSLRIIKEKQKWLNETLNFLFNYK